VLRSLLLELCAGLILTIRIVFVGFDTFHYVHFRRRMSKWRIEVYDPCHARALSFYVLAKYLSSLPFLSPLPLIGFGSSLHRRHQCCFRFRRFSTL
jgi:hypothetical protein